LFEGREIEEEPTQPVPAPAPPVDSIGAEPAMAGEENQLINSGRFGVDPNFKMPEPEEGPKPSPEVPTSSAAKDMNGHYKCAGVLPTAATCLDMGDLIAEWFLERMLNPKVMCDYNTGSCGSL